VFEYFHKIINSNIQAVEGVILKKKRTKELGYYPHQYQYSILSSYAAIAH